MLVEVTTKAQARRLELDGYTRTGKKAIEAEFDHLDELLDREDTTISKVVLNRGNGADEAEIIDEYVKAGVPDLTGGKISKYTYRFSDYHGEIAEKKHTVLTASVHSLKVKREYRNALLDGPITDDITSEDSFQEAKAEQINYISEQIASLQDELQQARERTLSDVRER